MGSRLIERASSGEFVLIAEIGVNYYDIARIHDISFMEAAKLMVKEARNAGIHAVKFQTYKAETLASKNSPSYWDTREEPITSQFELFRKFDSFSLAEYRELASYCRELDIEFLSTPFDLESADYLAELMEVYKISSSDLNNLPFITHQAKKGKPILLSIGASYENEVEEAVSCIRRYNNQPLVLLHCVLEYPTPYEHANLNRIATLKQKYSDLLVGYSDHTKPDLHLDIIKTAYTLGAIVIEKHFTLDKTLKGNDHYHAMDPTDARNIIAGIEYIRSIRGSYEIECLESEMIARKNARRSLVTTVNILKGEKISLDMLTSKRPGSGIPPTEIDFVLGKRALVDISEDTILQDYMIL